MHLNECFKKLYGFTNQSKKVSYAAKLKEIMPLFHGPDREFARILDDLEEILNRDSWWKDIRCAIL